MKQASTNSHDWSIRYRLKVKVASNLLRTVILKIDSMSYSKDEAGPVNFNHYVVLRLLVLCFDDFGHIFKYP